MAILSTFLFLLVLCSSALADCSPGWACFLSLIRMIYGVKCNQQDRDENKYGGNCIAVNIEGLLRLTHPRLHFFFFLYHFFCVFCVLRKQHAWPKQVMWCNTTLQIIFLPRKEGCHNTLTLLGWSYIRQEFQYIWDEPLIHLQWALFVYQMCHLWCRTRFHWTSIVVYFC